MVRLFIILIALILSGCGNDNMRAIKQDMFCENKGGVYSYHYGLVGKCYDGTSFVLSDLPERITPEWQKELKRRQSEMQK